MTNEQNIIAVPVPVDAHDIKCNYQQVGYDTPSSTQIEVVNITTGLTPETNMQFLGCVSFKDGEYIFDFGLKLGIFNFEDFFIYHLQSMGHYWVNPLGEKPQRRVPFMHAGYYTDRDKEAIAEYEQDLKAWRAAQEKCLRPDQKLAVMKIGE